VLVKKRTAVVIRKVSKQQNHPHLSLGHVAITAKVKLEPEPDSMILIGGGLSLWGIRVLEVGEEIKASYHLISQSSQLSINLIREEHDNLSLEWKVVPLKIDKEGGGLEQFPSAIMN